MVLKLRRKNIKGKIIDPHRKKYLYLYSRAANVIKKVNKAKKAWMPSKENTISESRTFS
jgi:hypothetical protein